MGIYNLKERNDLRLLARKLKRHLKQGHTVILDQKREQRSNAQNRYLHLLFSLFGIELGYTLAESKVIVKRACGLYYEKKGEKFIISTATLTEDQMSIFIDKFKKFAAEQGVYLPDTYSYEFQEYVDKYAPYM
jgi:hypothetical protein